MEVILSNRMQPITNQQIQQKPKFISPLQFIEDNQQRNYKHEIFER